MFTFGKHGCGLSVFTHRGFWLVSIPFLFMFTTATNDREFEELVFGARKGVEFRLNCWRFFLGTRTLFFPWADWILGEAVSCEKHLADPEHFRTSDGDFVMQRQLHYRQRPRWPARIGEEVVYRVISSPFELESCNVFTLDDPLQIAQNCRNVAQLVREMRNDLQHDLTKET